MTDPDQFQANGIGAEKLAVIIAMIVQICGIVWLIAVLYSSVNYNKDELREINDKLSNELNDIKIRMRAAEKEISIIDKIMEMEKRKK